MQVSLMYSLLRAYDLVSISQGETEQMQLSLISALCGPINETSFPGCSRLSKYKEFKDTSALPQDVTQPRVSC